MLIQRAIPLGVAGLLVTAGLALAADTDRCRQGAPSQIGDSQGRSAWRAATHVVDAGTGTVLRLGRLQSGAFQIEMDGDGLEVRKILRANGDFDLALRAHDDVVTVIGRGGQLRVSRSEQAVDLSTASLAEADLDRVQELLAGSAAVRRFRGMRSMLARSTRSTALGGAVDIIDMMIGVLKGEAPTATPALAAADVSVVAGDEALAELDGPSCYEVWVGEVVAAWADYDGCISSFAWYNPLREVCAFAWVIRVESAWFRLIGCSSFPLKLEACDVEGEVAVR